MTHKHTNLYPDLKINGRLFPSWVLENYKEFKLKKVTTSGDPCNEPRDGTIREYQLFVSKILSYNSPYKNILLYFGVGAGKTRTAIQLYNTLYDNTPAWNVIILSKATLFKSETSTWKVELKKYLSKDDYEYRFKNIDFVSYDAPNSDVQFFNAIKNADTAKKNLYIIDECHNFISTVYNNISSQQGTKSQKIYDHIIQDQYENQDTRVIAISATPAVNIPFELALLFNLLRPGSFQTKEADFNTEFISPSSSFKTINYAKKNIFQRRIMGLVSYYIGSTSDYFATVKYEVVNVPMHEYQDNIYTYFETMEEKAARKQRIGKQKGAQTYKAYTRQACNFVFPSMGFGMTGETRPRPKNFQLSNKIGDALEKKKIKLDKPDKFFYSAENYIAKSNEYVIAFKQYIDNCNTEDIKLGHTIDDDISKCKNKYNFDYQKFVDKEHVKSTAFIELHKCSAKMLSIIFKIFESPGLVVVYSNYVMMEGLDIFKIYLQFFKYVQLDKQLSGNDYFRYTEYHGGIEQTTRNTNRDIYNKDENKYGAICKLILISPAGAEGMNLYNVRQIHIMEPHWNESRITQIVGRGRRMCGHKKLDKSERNVIVYRYKSVRRQAKIGDVKWTTDEYIENNAKTKEHLTQSFLNAIKEVAIDCELYSEHNKKSIDYKCFQFNQDSLFEQQIGPAYKEYYEDDLRYDNGLNSVNSEVVRIKVLKIQAVKQLSAPMDDPILYSTESTYLYHPDSYVVYDPVVHHAIGKVAIDENDLPKKLNKDTYIIDKLIPIELVPK